MNARALVGELVDVLQVYREDNDGEADGQQRRADRVLREARRFLGDEAGDDEDPGFNNVGEVAEIDAVAALTGFIEGTADIHVLAKLYSSAFVGAVRITSKDGVTESDAFAGGERLKDQEG